MFFLTEGNLVFGNTAGTTPFRTSYHMLYTLN